MIFFGVPNSAARIFFIFFLIEPGSGTAIDPGMTLIPLPNVVA